MAQATLQFNQENLFRFLNLTPNYSGDVISYCPIHKGDNNHAFSYCSKRNIWQCWTKKCHKKYGSDPVGLIAGVKNIDRQSAEQILRSLQNNNSTYIKTDTEHHDVTLIAKEPNFNFKNLITFNNVSCEIANRMGIDQAIINKFEGFLYIKDINNPLWGRVCFPIFNKEHKIVGFIGRETPYIKAREKWLLMPKGTIKSNYFFGFKQLQITNTIILVEGPKDVMKLHEFGITNVLGILGSQISREQINTLISLNVHKVYLLFDPDNAGIQASLDAIDRLKKYFIVVNKTKQLRNDPSKLTKEEICDVLK